MDTPATRPARLAATACLDDAYAAANLGTSVSSHPAYCVVSSEIRAKSREQSPILRDIFVNPFRPVTFDPSWRTVTTISLPTGIHAERAFDRLPILADALEDAGCDAAELLSHCRGVGPHVRGCWGIDMVLGKG